jgi:hypothetical protein
MNTLSAAAAAASLRDTDHIAAERRENARIRDFTLQAFRDMGFEAPATHANFVFIDLGRPAAEFRDACLEQGVRVGRDFPPLERTHCRISLGTWRRWRLRSACSVGCSRAEPRAREPPGSHRVTTPSRLGAPPGASPRFAGLRETLGT